MRFKDVTQVIEKARSDPGSLKVCWGCGGIFQERAVRCTSCAGYRFTSNTECVVAQALLIASRPPVSVTMEDLVG